jgi:hypothetical protein
MRALRTCTLALTGCVLLAAPGAQAAPAAPTQGDNREAPIDIALNSTTTVKQIQNATLEAPSVEETTCDPSGLTDHSVWFRFTTPMTMLLDLDAAGAFIDGAMEMHSRVVVSYYEDVAGVITHRDCTSGDSPRLEDLLLGADKVYYVRIANSGDEPTGPSEYKLSARARFGLSPAQPEFVATEEIGTRWTTRKASPSQIERACATPPSTDCRIDFKGVAKGEFFQRVDFDKAVMRLERGDLLFADASVFRTPPEGAEVELTIKIKYSDGTRPTTVRATRHIINTSTNVAMFVGGILAKVAGQVKSITYSVSSPHDDDVFSVLSYSTELYAGS